LWVEEAIAGSKVSGAGHFGREALQRLGGGWCQLTCEDRRG
jgi:hypothetical protein